MRIFSIISFSIFINLHISSYASEAIIKRSLWDESWESVSWMGKGSYLQFTQRNSLYYAGVGIPSMWSAFENDKRIKARYSGTDIVNIVDHIGDAGVALSFPFLHLGFYYYGEKTKNNHHIQFAKEYFSSMYLALIESGVLSYIQIHERPVTGNESFWEKEFRGQSSWPSGHVIPYMTLFFKTLQFYGPGWASIPLGLSIMAGMQRVQDQKHWLSDIAASFFLSAWASEGVRAAAKYKKNHAFYKWIFEHKVEVGLLHHADSFGPMLSWTY